MVWLSRCGDRDAMNGPVLVTGSVGFIGTHLLADLYAHGCEPLALPEALRLPAEAELLSFLADARPSAIVHCAGTSSVAGSFKYRDADFTSNVSSTRSILEAAARLAEPPHVVLLSSAAVYGQPADLPVKEDAPLRPLSPYGFHKAAAELLCREYSSCAGVPTSVLRVFSAYGPGLRRQVLWDIAQQARAGRVLLGGTGEETRDFIEIDDLVEVVALTLARAPRDGSPVNAAAGEPVTIARLARLLLAALGSDVPVEFTGESRVGDPARWHADLTTLRGLGKKSFRSLDEGVARYAAWVRAEGGA